MAELSQAQKDLREDASGFDPPWYYALRAILFSSLFHPPPQLISRAVAQRTMLPKDLKERSGRGTILKNKALKTEEK